MRSVLGGRRSVMAEMQNDECRMQNQMQGSGASWLRSSFRIHHSAFCILNSLLLLPLPVPLGEGLSAGDVEVEALFGLEVVFDEPLGLVVGCFVLDNAGVL